ncbi:lipase 3-like isoform X1 [Haematobia irritans]|uniref:lipase 3-like isoform X1 n=1 Tax=Haematobia irritans TaxID=7368 RepID=UPI003F4FE9CD
MPFLVKVASIISFALLIQYEGGALADDDTCDKAIEFGYPCERHWITTKDGYILTMFHIPHGRQRASNESVTERPPVLFMHCVSCSSDIWIVNGRESSLPFMMADAEYDVWLGNTRGNTYGMNHTTIKRSSTKFWAYALDEISTIDVPAKIDYILEKTKFPNLHYVAYSQGTTNLVIALANDASYNQKLRSTHFIGPTIFVCNVGGFFPTIGIPFVGTSNPISRIVGTIPTYEVYSFLRVFLQTQCTRPVIQDLCILGVNMIFGSDATYLNRTSLPELTRTHPSPASIRQINHFAQMSLAGKLQAYDFGHEGNIRKYGRPLPPSYNLANVHPETPIEMYFSDSDFMSNIPDLARTYKIIGRRARWHEFKYKYSHLDLSVGLYIKECLYDCILDKIQEYEGRLFKGNQCKCFKKKNSF